MSENINVVPLRLPNEVDDPLTKSCDLVRGSCLRGQSRWRPRRFSSQ